MDLSALPQRINGRHVQIFWIFYPFAGTDEVYEIFYNTPEFTGRIGPALWVPVLTNQSATITKLVLCAIETAFRYGICKPSKGTKELKKKSQLVGFGNPINLVNSLNYAATSACIVKKDEPGGLPVTVCISLSKLEKQVRRMHKTMIKKEWWSYPEVLGQGMIWLRANWRDCSWRGGSTQSRTLKNSRRYPVAFAMDLNSQVINRRMICSK